METLRNELYDAVEKINNGYKMNEYESEMFLEASMYFLHMFGNDPKLVEARHKVDFPEKGYDETIEKCKKFSDVIKPKFSEILYNIDVDRDLDDEYLGDIVDMKIDILKFYKGFDRKHYKLIQGLVLDHKRCSVEGYTFVPNNGICKIVASSIRYNGKNYVYTTAKDGDYQYSSGPFKMFTYATMVHELGHIIDFNYRDLRKKPWSAFCETIPYTAEFSYLGVNNNSLESAKIYFPFLNFMAMILKTLDEREFESHEVKYYFYIVGYSIGLYLSHLYRTNIIKFRFYYNLLKKNVYVKDDKLINMFLNDEDFIKMDYLKQDISRNKKILLKA